MGGGCGGWGILLTTCFLSFKAIRTYLYATEINLKPQKQAANCLLRAQLN